jgi:hypothetical protein
MSHSLFQEGGEHRIRRTGPDQYEMRITVPPDADGRVARECPSAECSPGYFKVKMGTGITGGQQVAYCPYCRHEAEPNDFTTKDQMRYAKDLMMREAEKGMDRMFRDALGLGSSGSRRIGGGMFSIEMSYKPGTPRHVRRPFGEELRRDVVCPHCTLDHSVFGLAVWCSDCGRDIFMTHVRAEFSVVEKMLSDVDRRRELLGARVAARDIENCLEDTVSIFEAVLRALIGRHMKAKCVTPDQIDEMFRKKIANRFQSVSQSQRILRDEFGIELFADKSADVVETLAKTFEKRHPITHNLGVVDRKYIERVQSAEREGREVRVTAEEISQAMGVSMDVLGALHGTLFPPNGTT